MAKQKKQIKIVVIGAGSISFGRGVLADVLGDQYMQELNVTLTLVDIDAAALDRMAKVAELIRQHYGSTVTIEQTTSRRKALKGADYVVISVAINRWTLWEQDYRLPHAHGFKQALGENGGPGSLFHTLRSLELLLPICKDVQRICPDALVLNFTNPESRVLMGMNYLTKLEAIGLCHGQLESRRWLAERILQRPLEEIETAAGGLNHFFWVTKIVEKKTGKDLYPLVRQRIADDPSLAPPLVRKMVELFGCFTYPSDDHIGEYLSFGAEFTGLKWPYGMEHRKVPCAGFEPSQNWLEPYIAGEKAPDKDLVQPSGEILADVITGLELNRRIWLPAINVLNQGLYVQNLPEDAIVEVPAVADRRGIAPQHIGPIPEPLAAYCRTQISIQQLIIEAYRIRSKKLLLQALLLDPVVNSVVNAQKLLDEMLELQADYLPKFE